MRQLSTQEIAAVLNNRAVQLAKQQGSQPRRAAQSLDEDAAVARGDKFLETLGFDGDGDSEYASHPVSINEIQEDMSISREAFKNSKMNPAIKNMLMETSKVEQSKITDNFSGDRLNKMKALMKEDGRKVSSAGSSSIDYSVIKAIVNECLNEYFSKNKLNESANLTGVTIKDNKISLVDGKGNVFRAKLEFVGNKNDKKK